MVTVDLRLIGASGIGRYLQQVVPRVIAATPDVEWTLLGDPAVLAPWERAAGGQARVAACTAPVYSLREQWEVARRVPRATRLLWTPWYNIPLLHRGRLLVTIYDVAHLVRPELARGAHKRAYARGMFDMVRRRAGCVLSISEFTTGELVDRVGVARERIVTTPLAVDAFWFGGNGGPPPHARPYALYVGNVKPHKNVGGLVRAFEAVSRRVPHDLVIVGRRDGFITGDPAALARAEALGARVRFTGSVDDHELRRWLRGAAALVLPSFYEGFGLPPLEAMACGCPVLVSRVAALPEVCGDAALYCDPHDVADVAARLEQVLTDEPLRARLRAAGPPRARAFTWERCAEATGAAVRRLLAS